MDSSSPQNRQHEYYLKTAAHYDDAHLKPGQISEHDFALSFLSSVVKLHKLKSILDVGSGTGRAIRFLINEHPTLRVVGLEPVDELREQGYAKGIDKAKLIKGDAYSIPFAEGEFDLVCEFGVLHHVREPEKIIAEMLRVSSKGIFISDSNNFGQGSEFSRRLKQIVNLLGLWKIYDLIRTRGRGFHFSEGDGIFFSYSVFNNYKQIKKSCSKIHFLDTLGASYNMYKNSPHVALFAIKNTNTKNEKL